VLRTAFTIVQLPAKATSRALKSAISPAAINTLSSAIAQASIQTADADEDVSIDGVNITIDFDEERLLTTAGISTVIAMGTLYWIGSKLKIEYRYAAMIKALEELQTAIRSNNSSQTAKILNEIDVLSNPLIDPETLLPVEASDELKVVYETLFEKPATNGSMFTADDFIKGVRSNARSSIGRGIALSQTDDALKAMITKAAPKAGSIGSRLVGGVLWVDTVLWVATSALDLGLNYVGIEEENQRIPILADIPFIGALFDLSDSTGVSIVGLVVEPLIEGIIGFFSAEDEVEVLMNALFGIITSAALNPTLTPFIIAVLDFYIEDVGIEFEVPATFDVQSFTGEIGFEIFRFRPEPIEILVVWFYLITGKIVVKHWIIPAFRKMVGVSVDA